MSGREELMRIHAGECDILFDHFPYERFGKEELDEKSVQFVHANPVIFAKLTRLEGAQRLGHRESWQLWSGANELFLLLQHSDVGPEVIANVADVLNCPYTPLAIDFTDEELATLDALPMDSGLGFLQALVPRPPKDIGMVPIRHVASVDAP